MFREKEFYGQNPNVVVRSKTVFNNPLKWQRTGELPAGSKIFTCSWSDFFIEEADEWRPEAWKTIQQTPQYIYQILTKRPERITQHLPNVWPLPNVWLGVSVENERMFRPRVEALESAPSRYASIRFLSLEPLLSDIWIEPDLMGQTSCGRPNWVIVGCESGSKRRPMKTDYAKSIMEQCKSAGVP